MTTRQALDLLTQAANNYHGTKADHDALAQALEIMRNLIEALKEPE